MSRNVVEVELRNIQGRSKVLIGGVIFDRDTKQVTLVFDEDMYQKNKVRSFVHQWLPHNIARIGWEMEDGRGSRHKAHFSGGHRFHSSYAPDIITMAATGVHVHLFYVGRSGFEGAVGKVLSLLVRGGYLNRNDVDIVTNAISRTEYCLNYERDQGIFLVRNEVTAADIYINGPMVPQNICGDILAKNTMNLSSEYSNAVLLVTVFFISGLFCIGVLMIADWLGVSRENNENVTSSETSKKTKKKRRSRELGSGDDERLTQHYRRRKVQTSIYSKPDLHKSESTPEVDTSKRYGRP